MRVVYCYWDSTVIPYYKPLNVRYQISSEENAYEEEVADNVNSSYKNIVIV